MTTERASVWCLHAGGYENGFWKPRLSNIGKCLWQKLTLAGYAFLQILPLTGLHLDADQSATLTKGLATNGVNFTAPFRPYVFLSEYRKHFETWSLKNNCHCKNELEKGPTLSSTQLVCFLKKNGLQNCSVCSQSLWSANIIPPSLTKLQRLVQGFVMLICNSSCSHPGALLSRSCLCLPFRKIEGRMQAV
jgi:hypothetical protein